ISMTTDPGDLVLDPTCGAGTTAFVTERWGRRWITIDTSRIAINIAKTQLMTATFPFYSLYQSEEGERAVAERKGKPGDYSLVKEREKSQASRPATRPRTQSSAVSSGFRPPSCTPKAITERTAARKKLIYTSAQSLAPLANKLSPKPSKRAAISATAIGC